MKTKATFILLVAALLTSMAPQSLAQTTRLAATADQPFTIEGYYKVKWGYVDEFIDLDKLKAEEKRRFELLIAHWDVETTTVDVSK